MAERVFRSFNGVTMCRFCANAKDHYAGKGAEACFCVQYGIIIAHKKERCKGYKSKTSGEDEKDAND